MAGVVRAAGENKPSKQEIAIAHNNLLKTHTKSTQPPASAFVAPVDCYRPKGRGAHYARRL